MISSSNPYPILLLGWSKCLLGSQLCRGGRVCCSGWSYQGCSILVWWNQGSRIWQSEHQSFCVRILDNENKKIFKNSICPTLGSAMVQVITLKWSGQRLRNLAVEWFTTRATHTGRLWWSAIMLLLGICKVINFWLIDWINFDWF